MNNSKSTVLWLFFPQTIITITTEHVDNNILWSSKLMSQSISDIIKHRSQCVGASPLLSHRSPGYVDPRCRSCRGSRFLLGNTLVSHQTWCWKWGETFIFFFFLRRCCEQIRHLQLRGHVKQKNYSSFKTAEGVRSQKEKNMRMKIASPY